MSKWLLYFLLVVLVLLWRSRSVGGPWWFLLRSFFPNWKFYDVVGHVPRVWLRWQSDQGEWSAEVLWWPRQPYNGWQLWHNPWGNLALARQNLIDHWASDLAGASRSHSLALRVSSELVRRHLSHDVLEQYPQASAFQYVLRMEHPDPQHPQAILQVMRSAVIDLGQGGGG